MPSKGAKPSTHPYSKAAPRTRTDQRVDSHRSGVCMKAAPATAARDMRLHPRVTVAIAVFCERQGAPPVQGTARDIGVGGAFVESTEPLLFGTEVVIVARLANGGAVLRLPAIVRWTKPNGFGVQFGLLGARETHALAELSKR